MDFMRSKLQNKLTEAEYKEIEESIVKMEIVPSMRLLWSAGPAAERSNVTAYNCSYIAPTKAQDFGEILYLLTCGAGVGFTVEKAVIDQLPVVKEQTFNVIKILTVEDDKEGWADALAFGIESWMDGNDVDYDYSAIRPEGARLKTMGGRASGPEPLRGLLVFVRDVILSAQGRKLTSLEVHDIICKIGDVVVSGGVRRSSEISLSDLNDSEMMSAKSGEFWKDHPQRMMANNSAIYEKKPDREDFDREWESLVRSNTGERGIFNRGGLLSQIPSRRTIVPFMGTNPCGEITLRPKEFCNLTEVVCRSTDTKESLARKIRLASILGTYQSSLTDFGYLSEEWKKNCQEEALLGVSLTGQYDCPIVRKAETLSYLRDIAVATNKEYAIRIGINQSASVTAVKPSGTVSQLVDASSGMHPRFSKYYLRRVRISSTDPLFKMMRDQGVKYYPETGYTYDNARTYVLEFPVASPDHAVISDELSAIEQLEYWKVVKQNYTEHNPSCTIYVTSSEWEEVGNWVYDNFDYIGGLSFLPKDDHIYPLAPYQPITKEEYESILSQFPTLNYSQLTRYEVEDNTEGAKTLACAGNVCEIA